MEPQGYENEDQGRIPDKEYYQIHGVGVEVVQPEDECQCPAKEFKKTMIWSFDPETPSDEHWDGCPFYVPSK